MPVLSSSEIAEALTKLPGWQLEASELTRGFVFLDFREAMKFVNGVAELAEREGHHPDIDIRYSKVRLGLVSHDAGGITERDIALAGEISAIL